MAKIVWTETALADLRSMIDFIARDSKVYAERFGTRVAQAPRRLKEFRLSGRVVPECNDESIRELIYGAYRIIYKVDSGICYIVAVIHGSRDILRHVKPGEWVIE